MKTVLVLGPQNTLADAIRNLLDANLFRVLPHSEVWEAEPLLRQGFIDLCLIDAELTSIEPIRMVEQLRSLAPQAPILVFAGELRQEWEEEAYLLGVMHVLAKPVRGRVLRALIQRLWPAGTVTPPLPAELRAGAEERPATKSSTSNSKHTLEILRDFSGILCHSLCSEALLRQFLLLLREIIGINRAAIFLRPPPSSLAMTVQAGNDRRMHAACAIGIATGLLDHFDLSLDSGIGGQVFHHGHILRVQNEECRRDREIQKEFELLGSEVAIPIWDRESLVGVAVFDGRLTGEPFTSEELSLIFLLLEQLGLAIKNTWLHDQLAANHQIMLDILNQTGSGCLVVGRNLEILHANRAAQLLFSRSKNHPSGHVEFSDLPQPLASRVFEMLKAGQPEAPFKYRPASAPGTVYQVNISQFRRQNASSPNAVLMIVEDITQHEKARMFEIQEANHRLLQTMAAQLAHEIGNSLVPLSTHQQLLASKMTDPEFIQSLTGVMAEGVRRIGRLSSQMLYLAMTELDRTDAIPMRELVEEAFAEARASFGAERSHLSFDEGFTPPPLLGNHRALRHALAEILLNALQANPADPHARVRFRGDSVSNGGPMLVVELLDAGKGFTPEAIHKAFDPFYTTRPVGLGLGLTVAQRIVQAHQGHLEIATLTGVPGGAVRLSLPQTTPSAPAPSRQGAKQVLLR